MSQLKPQLNINDVCEVSFENSEISQTRNESIDFDKLRYELSLAYQKEKFRLLKEEYDTKINRLTEQLNAAMKMIHDLSEKQEEIKQHNENNIYKQIINGLSNSQIDNVDIKDRLSEINNIFKFVGLLRENNDENSELKPKRSNRKRPIYAE